MSVLIRAMIDAVVVPGNRPGTRDPVELHARTLEQRLAELGRHVDVPVAREQPGRAVALRVQTFYVNDV